MSADRFDSRPPQDWGRIREIRDRAAEKERFFAAMISVPNSQRAIRQFFGRGVRSACDGSSGSGSVVFQTR